MSTIDYTQYIQRTLGDAEISISADDIQERSFPGERWLIVFVAADALLVAQSLSGAIERDLNDLDNSGEPSFTVVFRSKPNEEKPAASQGSRSRLYAPKIDQLIQLLEARSRTSDALPSLKYVADPRASLPAVATSRHQFIYGRRGVGKTALLLEAKRLAERQGDVTVWMNAHVIRNLDAATAFLHIADAVLTSLGKHAGASEAEAFARIKDQSDSVTSALASDRTIDRRTVAKLLANLNAALRGVLRQDIIRLYIYIDDFYLFSLVDQPQLLDYVFAMLRDCNGWIKVASIERLTRPFEPSSKVGLEIPHDASKIDLDITLEDPAAAQAFLEKVLSNYTSAVSVDKPSQIAKAEALGRLVLASGGVPRDYLNLFASSIVVAREARAQAQRVGREDVAVAAGRAARGKKRDLELDVAAPQAANVLLSAMEKLSSLVKGYGFAYFRVNVEEKSHIGYEILAQLVDLRFVHLIQAVLSDQHKGGTRYEAYTLDLSEYTDVRSKRGREVLDLEDGQWYWRLAGKAQTQKKLTGTQLRDRLRLSPLISVRDLIQEV